MNVANDQIVANNVRSKNIVDRHINLTNLSDVFSDGVIKIRTSSTNAQKIKWSNSSITTNYSENKAYNSATVAFNAFYSLFDSNNTSGIELTTINSNSANVVLTVKGNSGNTSTFTVTGTSTAGYAIFASNSTEIARITTENNGIKLVSASTERESIIFYTANTPYAVVGSDSASTYTDLYLRARTSTSSANRSSAIIISGATATDTGNIIQLITYDNSGNNTSIVLTGGTGAAAGQVSLNSDVKVGYGTGSKIGFYGTTPILRPGVWSITNPSTDRGLDVTGDTLAQVAAVLGTLIQDLKDLGLLG